MQKKGFTLIELLVAIAVMSLLVGIVAFALRGAQKAGRDTRRKSDLEQVRAALEFYRDSCGTYPASLSFGGSLNGTGTGNCTGSFMEKVPQDIAASSRVYSYRYISGTNDYYICASLEDAPNPAMNVSNCNSCGSVACNYILTSP